MHDVNYFIEKKGKNWVLKSSIKPYLSYLQTNHIENKCFITLAANATLCQMKETVLNIHWRWNLMVIINITIKAVLPLCGDTYFQSVLEGTKRSILEAFLGKNMKQNVFLALPGKLKIKIKHYRKDT